MSLTLYFDHNVDVAIVLELRKRNVDALTAREDGNDTLDDEHVLERATELGRILVSNDNDFTALSERWLRESRQFAGIIRTRQENISIGVLVEDLELVAKVLEPSEMVGRIVYLPFPRPFRQ